MDTVTTQNPLVRSKLGPRNTDTWLNTNLWPSLTPRGVTSDFSPKSDGSDPKDDKYLVHHKII